MTETITFYDETASKILVRALLAPTDAEIVLAVTGLRRHMGTESVSAHDAKIFFTEGDSSQWMRSAMHSVNYAQDRALKAEATTRRYKARLAVVEAALRRMRMILKALSGSDTKDSLLQFEIDRAAPTIPNTDVSDDKGDMALASLYETANE